MKISRRIGIQWEKQENKDKKYCDECKKQPWQAPHNGLYCNTDDCGRDYQHTNSKK